MKKLLILIFLFTFTGSAWATNYYVATTGSNSNPGTSGSPWLTIDYASAHIVAGDTVHVAAGTYTSGGFSTRSSGSSGSRIVYVSDTVWGAHIVSNSSTAWTNYGNYVDIVGFDVTSVGYNGIYTEGIYTRITGNNVHNVRTGVCEGMGGSGINLNGSYATVSQNLVHDNGPVGCTYVHGIYFLQPYGWAYNNIVVHNGGFGIQLWHGPTNIVITNNTIANNGIGGIVIGNNLTTADYCVVNNNILMNNSSFGGVHEEGSTGIHNVYQNNLVYGNTPYNISLQNGLTATGTVTANPLFVNYTGTYTGDYHLQAGSPAIGAGTSSNAPATDYAGNSRPQGSSYDIGAYEYVNPMVVTLAPSALTFASLPVGFTSPSQNVVLNNNTASTLAISSIALGGTNSGDFSQTNTCGGTLSPPTSCNISVNFTPTAIGSRSATLTVTDNGTGSPRIVALSGFATAATGGHSTFVGTVTCTGTVTIQ